MTARRETTRRDALRALLGACVAAACEPPRAGACPEAAATPAPARAEKPAAPRPLAPGEKLKVLCVAAHPDDAASGCGGTLARYVAAGHDVHVLYVTKGELGIEGKSPEETGAIRAAEATEACKILGVTPHFFGHPSGSLSITPAILDEMIARFDELGADVVFAHWPLDTNYEHTIAGTLAADAWLAKPRRAPLYFFEVEAGTQTIGFVPDVYVEIGPVVAKKIAAIGAHKSQDAERRLYERHHDPMERFRAREIAGTAAEAFRALAPEARMTSLPGL